MSIRDSLKEICSSLNKYNVEYMIIGGVAVGFHGFPRSTADIDFWYNPTTENFNRIINALDDRDIDTTSLKEIIFDPKTAFVRIPHEKLGFRTEFLPHIPGLSSFLQARSNGILTDIDGVKITILGYEDLIKNKESVKRAKDMNDIEELRKRNPKG